MKQTHPRNSRGILAKFLVLTAIFFIIVVLAAVVNEELHMRMVSMLNH